MLPNPAIAAPIVGANKIDHLHDAVASHSIPPWAADGPLVFAEMSNAPSSKLLLCRATILQAARRDHQFQKTLN
jgi:hypothetical protein